MLANENRAFLEIQEKGDEVKGKYYIIATNTGDVRKTPRPPRELPHAPPLSLCVLWVSLCVVCVTLSLSFSRLK